MRRTPLLAFPFFVLTACGASQVPQSAPPGDPPAASASASPSASPPATTASGAGSDEIPPVEDACTRDDECAVVGAAFGPTACCTNRCDETPVRKDWVPKFRAACAARDARKHPPSEASRSADDPDCPTMICGGVPPQNPHCVAGHCVVR